MEVKQRSLILSVGKPYNFVPEGETEALTGCKMYYVGTDNIANTYVDSENETLGYFPQKYTMPTEFYEVAKNVGLPCYADITYTIKLTAKGSDVSITSVNFVESKGNK